MTISAPWSALSGVDILSVQHHLCPDLTWEIFMNLWNNTKPLSPRLVLLTINVVQDIYCKFSRYPWSLNVCTKFDNVFIWWKVSGMFSFHDSEYKLISTRWKQSIKIEPEVYLRWIRDRWVTSLHFARTFSSLNISIIWLWPGGGPWGAQQQSWQLMQTTLISPGLRETVRKEIRTDETLLYNLATYGALDFSSKGSSLIQILQYNGMLRTLVKIMYNHQKIIYIGKAPTNCILYANRPLEKY